VSRNLPDDTFVARIIGAAARHARRSVLTETGHQAAVTEIAGLAGAAAASRAGQQAAGELALIQAGSFQPSRHKQHQLAFIDREIMLAAGGEHLPGEPLDSPPVNRAAQQPQPRRPGVGELIPVPQLLRPDGAQERVPSGSSS
jgi:hypothetical protein